MTFSSSRSLGVTLKLVFDVVLAALLIVLMLPLLVGIAGLVRLSGPGPALFRQTRVGKGGRTFACWKFRTMAVDADVALARHLETNPAAAAEWRETRKLTHDPRVTAVGHVLRVTSLDELPQLLNIVMGQMSFVGPRPIVPDEIPLYGEAFDHCFSVRPGLTGLWQVSGRSDCSYATRVALDARYVRDWRFIGDLVILARTVPAVLLRKGSR